MALESAPRRSRRAVLASAIGGAAAIAATQLVGPARTMAATGPVNLDTDNPADSTTSITTTAAASAFAGTSNAAATGIGVTGRNSFVTAGVEYSNVGVFGVAGANPVDWAPDDMETGVYGYADTSFWATGVLGVSPMGFGAYGWGDYGVTGNGGTVGIEGFTNDGAGRGTGVGVLGYAGSGPTTLPTNVGVMAYAPSTGRALVVSGRTAFSRAGRAVVSKGRRSVDVTVSAGGLTTSSQVIATATKLVTGTYVQAAVYLSSTKIRIYLNKTAPASTSVAWIVLN